MPQRSSALILRLGLHSPNGTPPPTYPFARSSKRQQLGGEMLNIGSLGGKMIARQPHGVAHKSKGNGNFISNHHLLSERHCLRLASRAFLLVVPERRSAWLLAPSRVALQPTRLGDPLPPICKGASTNQRFRHQRCEHAEAIVVFELG